MTVWRARTEGNKTVLFGGNSVKPGDLAAVKVEHADAFTLHGQKVSAN
jgi:tRNA A37 methylthiotransferase MiaB